MYVCVYGGVGVGGWMGGWMWRGVVGGGGVVKSQESDNQDILGGVGRWPADTAEQADVWRTRQGRRWRRREVENKRGGEGGRQRGVAEEGRV